MELIEKMESKHWDTLRNIALGNDLIFNSAIDDLLRAEFVTSWPPVVTPRGDDALRALWMSLGTPKSEDVRRELLIGEQCRASGRDRFAYDLGTFTVEDGQFLTVGDPAHHEDPTLTVKVNAVPGTWTATAVFMDRGKFGIRVGALMARLTTSTSRATHELGLIGVDSGTAGIFTETGGDYWYETCCEVATSSPRAGRTSGGVVSATGFGDGSYPVLVDNPTQTSALEIWFLEKP